MLTLQLPGVARATSERHHRPLGAKKSGCHCAICERHHRPLGAKTRSHTAICESYHRPLGAKTWSHSAICESHHRPLGAKTWSHSAICKSHHRPLGAKTWSHSASCELHHRPQRCSCLRRVWGGSQRCQSAAPVWAAASATDGERSGCGRVSRGARCSPAGTSHRPPAQDSVDETRHVFNQVKILAEVKKMLYSSLVVQKIHITVNMKFSLVPLNSNPLSELYSFRITKMVSYIQFCYSL